MALVVTVAFKCSCGELNLLAYESNYGDSLNYNCKECSRLYKKSGRIEEHQVVWVTLADAPCWHCLKPEANCICGYV